ncbi:PD-(D/E)XK nuclease family protein [Rhodococcus fascians]|nr:PD-(D/E)XK nuclease family protein [Rhodococcus fascians]MBY3826488.1 PD-(D/E)XK nuclease family protein [Rhodococcus fascians]MBY3836949.1 PD-(D/E)XK nuclease family protein [Rhodococcus fascians]MBY3865584.1 PD-(D/E)XK nuclease family protein [Rhodococcus fascians]MBY3885631.1 PD-(D/E)XK nuclease family protein [Rhodococcus fascians]
MHSDSVDPLDALAAHPLYQLSTAGQELFHTNMLYWLITQHPHAAVPILAALGLPPTEKKTAVSVVREWRHFDLFVDNGDYQVVLENKLHAFPDRDQLEKYRADLAPKYQSNTVIFVLLSMIEPIFTMPDPWVQIDYASLIAPIKATADLIDTAESFDRALVGEYADLLTLLVEFRDDLRAATTPDQPILLDKKSRSHYQQGRVLPLVERYRIIALVNLIQKFLGEVKEIGTGLTNTHGVAGYFVRNAAGHDIGWQYQDGKLRLAIQLDAANKEKWRGKTAEKKTLANQIAAKTFGTSEVQSIMSGLMAYTGKLDWLSYEPNFLYTYRSVSASTTYNDLVQICVELIRYLDENVAGK